MKLGKQQEKDLQGLRGREEEMKSVQQAKGGINGQSGSRVFLNSSFRSHISFV